MFSYFSSSSESEEEEEEEDGLEEEEEEELVFKSDHEFSPESDLEENDTVPVKRARTAREGEILYLTPLLLMINSYCVFYRLKDGRDFSSVLYLAS